MEPYNVKIITYPDLSKRVKIYNKAIESGHSKSVERYSNPFNDKKCINVSDFDEHLKHSRDVSYKRTIGKVYDYARCNNWDYFVTFTFSKEKVDRYDYDLCSKRISEWIKRLKKKNPDMVYLVVPERHKDGAYHFHGLFGGLNESEIVWSGKYVVKRKGRQFVRTKDKIYRFGRYKLGWMTATKVKDMQRVTGYITKYITKDIISDLFGRKRYWVSRNLLLPQEDVYLLDPDDTMILGMELDEIAKYKKVSAVEYGQLTQKVEIFDL